MFYNQTTNPDNRSTSALEIALHARIREREMALLAGEYKGKQADTKKQNKNFLQVLFASLFLG